MKIMMIEISGSKRYKSANTLTPPPLSTGQCEPPVVSNLEANYIHRGCNMNQKFKQI